MRNLPYFVAYNRDTEKEKYYGPFVVRQDAVASLEEKGFRKLRPREGFGITSRHYYRDEDQVVAEIVELRNPASIPAINRRKKRK